jgi:maltose O-acetyltransferase
MLAGEPYFAGDPEIVADARRAMLLTERYNATSVDDGELRRSLLEDLLGSVGEGVELRPPFRCDFGFNINIGARSFANFDLIVLDVARVDIGEDAWIGPGVQILTATHPVEPGPRRAKVEGARPIALGANVWLGGGAIVLPGVTIGDDTVVGAGAVVTRDLPAGVVAVGNPARIVREIQPT